MKTYVKLLGVVMMVLTVVSSCRKDYDFHPAQSVIKPVILGGKWQMSEFVENRTDYTSLFYRIEFKFNVNGIVTATRDNVETLGKWKYFNDRDRIGYRFDFGPARDPYFRLNESWSVVRQDSLVIELKTIGMDQQTKFMRLKRM
jgi:hypothetical protein